MVKKILQLNDNILVLCGIFFAIRFIYTKDIYIQVYGYTVNTLELLILTIVLVAVHRTYEEKSEKTIEKVKSNKS
ncbi:hypothetical protein QFZ28_001377 [Neobacillus niacini]|jgi:hypothetical protein|nr:hypothetical protein [Neobacillus niacini]